LATGRGVGVAVGVGVAIGVAVGVGVGLDPRVIDGGAEYWLGQMEGIIPASTGLSRLTTPIWLLYRMLLGSPLANIGLCASAPVISLQRLGLFVAPLKIVGFEKPPGLRYWLKLVARHNPGGVGGVIHVLFVASLPTP
jgi:hypothetical protein